MLMTTLEIRTRVKARSMPWPLQDRTLETFVLKEFKNFAVQIRGLTIKMIEEAFSLIPAVRRVDKGKEIT